MIRIKKILVPVDFSETSKTAVKYGLTLALHFNARLVLACIIPVRTSLTYRFPENDSYERDTTFVKATLPTLVPVEYQGRADLQTVVRVGEVRDELLKLLSSEKIDLVIMGTQGKNVFERFVLGSLTDRMLRKISIPIVTVSQLDPNKGASTAGPIPLQALLYATDLSDTAAVGLKMSIEMARRTGARLVVLHVWHAPDTIYWAGEGGYLEQDLQILRDDRLARLKRSIPEECKGVKVTAIMAEGEPFREILRVSEEERVNLIVMNLRGKGPIERALLGSTVERVIRASRVPVLSIPVPRDSAAPANDR